MSVSAQPVEQVLIKTRICCILSYLLLLLQVDEA